MVEPRKANNRRPPELLPRDEVARAINAEIKALEMEIQELLREVTE